MTEQITLDSACMAGVPLCVTEQFLPGEGAVDRWCFLLIDTRKEEV